MNSNKNPIAVFDSGVGGISVLKHLIKIMPNENYIYYGDSKNAPYGTKSEDEILSFTELAIKKLVNMGSKAIVIACNTATSVAADKLRKSYSIPIIGIEPAVKPAAIGHRGESVLVMATPVTLQKEKFQRLIKNYSGLSKIIPLPCPGLADIIEKGVTEGEEITSYLEKLFEGIKKDSVAAIVLGCTHYPFIKESIKKYFPENIDIIDGGDGTAREAKRRLEEINALNTSKHEGSIEFISSMENTLELKLMKKLLNN